MIPKKSVISLIGFCVLSVLGAALALAIIIAGGAVALAGEQNSDEQRSPAVAQNETQNEALTPTPQASGTFNGMITDSHCGARHIRGSQNSSECARECVRNGSHYILVDGDKRYRLSGRKSTLATLAGQRATVTGVLRGDTIVVSAATPLQLP